MEVNGDINLLKYYYGVMMPSSKRHVYPITFARKIRKEWNTVVHPSLEEILPSDSILQELIEVAYQASLKRDETRDVRFRILLIDSVDLFAHFNHEWTPPIIKPLIINLEQAKPYSVSELVKFAFATRPSGYILVGYGDARGAISGALNIWGVIDYGQLVRNIDGRAASPFMPVSNLMLTSNEPGELLITSEGMRIVGLKNGTIVPLVYYDALFGFFLPAKEGLADAAIRRIQNDQLLRNISVAYDEQRHKGMIIQRSSREYFRTLYACLLHIMHLGHGGTLLLVRDGVDLQTHINFKYRADDKSNQAWTLLRERIIWIMREGLPRFEEYRSKKSADPEQVHQLKRDSMAAVVASEISLQEYMKSIATLASVDGAVVLTEKLELLGFGGEILTKDEPNEVLFNHKREEREARMATEYGTRHRSVFRFCNAVAESVGFIVSQDGGLKGVRKIGTQVVYWSDVHLQLATY